MTSSCPDSLFEKLSMHRKLASKVQSFVEANIDFEVFMDNIFTVRSSTTQGVPQDLAQSMAKSTLTRSIDNRDLTKSIAFRKLLTR